MFNRDCVFFSVHFVSIGYLLVCFVKAITCKIFYLTNSTDNVNCVNKATIPVFFWRIYFYFIVFQKDWGKILNTPIRMKYKMSKYLTIDSKNIIYALFAVQYNLSVHSMSGYTETGLQSVTLAAFITLPSATTLLSNHLAISATTERQNVRCLHKFHVWHLNGMSALVIVDRTQCSIFFRCLKWLSDGYCSLSPHSLVSYAAFITTEGTVAISD